MGKRKRQSVGDEEEDANISIKKECSEGDVSVKMESDLDALGYEDKLNFVNVIAHPMASKKLAKKVYKVIKKATKHKTFLYNGLKLVQNKIRNGATGLVVFAGDVTPIDIMCHMPILCEERQIPYVFTPSRKDIGTAMGVKRASLMVLIRHHEEYADHFNECIEEIKQLHAA